MATNKSADITFRFISCDVKKLVIWTNCDVSNSYDKVKFTPQQLFLIGGGAPHQLALKRYTSAPFFNVVSFLMMGGIC